MPQLTDPFFSEVSWGLFSIFSARDYSLGVASTDEDPVLERRAIAQMLARRVDALLITSVQPDLDALSALETMEIPFVSLHRRPSGGPANFAGWDDVGSGLAGATHLREIGCQRIAYIGGANSRPAADGQAGYIQALARQGSVPPEEYIVNGDCGESSWQAFGFRAMLQLLQLSPRPDGIFCWNDPVALGAIRAIEGAELRIPEDIAVVGCGNTHSDNWSSIPPSSIDQNSPRLGASAAMLALRLVERPAMVPQSLVVQAQLIIRASSQR